jgi:NAD(P)-dependent dehydrogenase (short-subunit alcohol dehydrogenase family)
MSNLAGKIALVAGGNSGIGLATTQELVARGAHVYITGRRQPELDAAVKTIGKNVTAVQGDVSKLADLDRLYAKIKAEKDHLDIVFANAGLGEAAPLEAVSETQFDMQFDVNVKGLFFTVQKALPLLRRGSSVILNASIAASKGFPGLSVYSATKAAIRSFARTWTSDLKGRGIRVNVVSPGSVQTPGLDGLAPDAQIRATMKEQFSSIVPLGRLGKADEIAKAVAFLASDDASFILGTELFVDGGAAQV